MIVTSHQIKFDIMEATQHLSLSATAYCVSETLQSHNFHGPISDFILTSTYHEDDIEGFVGYLPSDTSIYVVFRGSSTIASWIVDVQVTLTNYEENCCDSNSCQVHSGIYEAAQKAYSSILHAVKKLLELYPGAHVKCTGHSLGGALASLLAMYLHENEIFPTVVYTFGKPRIGNKNYAKCSSKLIPTIRVTHRKDIVPHIPFEMWGYHHECREAYESTTTSENPQVKDCDSEECEDYDCSNKWPYIDLNVDDHMTYLGLEMDCKAVTLE